MDLARSRRANHIRLNRHSCLLCNGRGLWADDILQAAREHKDLVDRARTADALGAFLALLEKVKSEFERFVTDHLSNPPAAVHLSVKYDPTSLQIIKMEIRGETDQCDGVEGDRVPQCRVVSSVLGSQELCLRGSSAFEADRQTHKVKTNAWMFRSLLQWIIDEQPFA